MKTKTARASKERRQMRRVPIRVLVKCLPPGIPARRNGHDSPGWEMWARNIGDDGVLLQWSKAWSAARCPQCTAPMDREKQRRQPCVCGSPVQVLKKGKSVELDGLIYTEKGSKPMRGQIRWVKPGRRGAICEFGVYITSPNHRNFFRILEDTGA